MYAFEQHVPINAEIHARLMEALGPEVPEGLIAHIALVTDDGTLRYLDLWRTRADCDRFTDDRLHPVIGRLLAAAGIAPESEPERHEVDVAYVWGELAPVPA